MTLLKSLALTSILALGFNVSANTNSEEGFNEEAILLFNGDETPMDEAEALALDENAVETDPAIRNIRIRCQSFFFFTSRCRVPGRVLSVRLVNQFGFQPCIAGRTFGANNRAIWVRNGCSGNFRVRYWR